MALTLLIVALSGPVAAQPSARSLPEAVWESEDDPNTVLDGYADRDTFTARLPAGWTLADDPLWTAELTASPAAGIETAVRIEADDLPLMSWTPSDDSNVVLELPKELFADGAVDIRATSTTTLAREAECRDPNHIARWVDIGSPGLTGDLMMEGIDVARAIRGMAEISVLTREPINLELPPDPSPATLDAAGAVVAAVAHDVVPFDIEVVTEADPAKPGATIRIVEDDTTSSVEVRQRSGRPIVELRASGDPLRELAHALADPDRQLFFHDTVVDLDQVPNHAPELPTEVFTFESLGYDDRTLRGAGEQSLLYRVDIPAGAPPHLVTLAVFATYAPILGKDESAVAVQINGSPEEILAVLDGSGEIDVLHTVQPANLRPGRNFVRVAAQLGGPSGEQCASGGPPNWFSVSQKSGIAVERPGTPRPPELGVEDARFALASRVDFEQTDVAVPDDPTRADLEAGARVIAELASRSGGGGPRLVTDSDLDTGRHLVVTGRTRATPPLVDLPISIDDGGVGLLAATASPYASGRVLMAFVGSDDGTTTMAVETGTSAAVNGVRSPFAYVGVDDVRELDYTIGGASPEGASSEAGQPPGSLAYSDGPWVDPTRQAGPSTTDYEDWIVEQAAIIEAADADTVAQRRTIALLIGIGLSIFSGLWWVRRTRAQDAAASGH